MTIKVKTRPFIDADLPMLQKFMATRPKATSIERAMNEKKNVLIREEFNDSTNTTDIIITVDGNEIAKLRKFV